MADKAKRRRCGANRKRGMGKCKAWAIEPIGRCRMHGGTSPGAPKGSKALVTHGIYVKALSPEEREMWNGLKHGSVIDELKMCRIQLNRVFNEMRRIAVEDEKEQERVEIGGLPSKYTGYEFDSIEDGDGEKGSFSKVVRKRPNFNKIINDLTSRIGTLERIEMELNGGSFDPDDKAALILRALRSMEENTHG